MQHCHDDTVITLLRTSISDSTPTTYIWAQLSNEVPRKKQKGRSFERVTLPEGEFPMVYIAICDCRRNYIPAESIRYQVSSLLWEWGLGTVQRY